MINKFDLPRALLRGRYMAAAARIEHNGVLIDTGMREALKINWEGMQDELIARVDAHYGVYEGRTFKRELFADYLRRHDIPWPMLPSGQLDLQDDTFKDMARSHSQLTQLRELRASLSQMRLDRLAIGMWETVQSVLKQVTEAKLTHVPEPT
jgi:DNA polymerase-1